MNTIEHDQFLEKIKPTLVAVSLASVFATFYVDRQNKRKETFGTVTLRLNKITRVTIII